MGPNEWAGLIIGGIAASMVFTILWCLVTWPSSKPVPAQPLRYMSHDARHRAGRREQS